MGFREVDVPRDQFVLWSKTLDDGIAADHPVRLFDRMLRSEMFAEVFTQWRQEYVLTDGRPPYAPLYLAGLYLYGMLYRIRSSRQLEAACHNRLDVIWLMQGQTPDHSTISGFVCRHGKHLQQLFRQTIKVALSADLVKLSHVAIDGTKLEADAGQGSVRSLAWLEAEKARLEAVAVALEKEWSANETWESTLLWSEQSPPPGDVRDLKARRASFAKRKQKVDQALAVIAQRSKESADSGGKKPKAIASLTDPESRVMPDKQGKRKPGYNGQIAVDDEAGIILANTVNDRPEDVGQMTPMLKQVEENTGSLPAACTLDSGYNSGDELAALEKMKVVGYLPDAGSNSGAVRGTPTPAQTAKAEALDAVRRGDVLSEDQWSALPRTRGQIDKSVFTYQPQSNTYRCPAGVSLPVLRHSADRKSWGVAHRTQYGGSEACATCAHARDCCTTPEKGRTVNRDQFEAHRERMRERMASEEGKQIYRKRATTVEPKFGVLKAALGFRRFLRRKLEKVRVEFALACTALNFQVLMREHEKVEAVLNKA
jgi:transposase